MIVKVLKVLPEHLDFAFKKPLRDLWGSWTPFCEFVCSDFCTFGALDGSNLSLKGIKVEPSETLSGKKKEGHEVQLSSGNFMETFFRD